MARVVFLSNDLAGRFARQQIDNVLSDLAEANKTMCIGGAPFGHFSLTIFIESNIH
jgi:hypothetical protein